MDRAVATTNECDAAFQQLIAEAACGRVWSRPDLTPRDISLITIALLAALGHDEEMEMRLRAASRTGAIEEEGVDTLPHAAIYARITTASRTFRTAKNVFAKLEATSARNDE